MSEVEKQESQKTVVAFITGLLIGGLLVWVFSSTPESKQQAEEKKTDTEQTTKVDTTAEGEVKKDDTAKADSKTQLPVGDGSVAVGDQKAGQTVLLGTLKLPTKTGWVAVRDYMDGVPGNVLGVARYSAEEGLMPTVVELARATTKGSSYQVVFFTDEGDGDFKVGEDKLIDGPVATFKAN